MNVREKRLLLAIGSVAGLLVAGWGVKVFFGRPLAEVDRQIGNLRRELNKITVERRGYFADEDKVKAFTERSFSDDVDKASAKSGEMLTRTILESGLAETDFTRLPVGPRRLRGASEIGWNVQGDGPLMQVINLLFLLQESPYLHRLENVTVSPSEGGGRVKVRFRFLTLVMEPAPPVVWREPTPKYTLDSPERRVLDMILLRDILRPYLKRQPTSPASPGGIPAAQAVASKPLPGPESLRVVSLSEWQGQAEAHVRDLVNQRTLRYQPGDALAGGIMVMVDYSPKPFPDRPILRSDSRVIIRIADEYWAIERGRTLADKYKLSPDELPETLEKL